MGKKDAIEFLEKYNISEARFKETGLNWDELQEIRKQFESMIPDLKHAARYLTEVFQEVKNVHSIKYRIKNPDGLIAKIIRKSIENPERKIIYANLQKEITDLIGLRVLHLFKEDWQSIHDFITNNWELQESPIAYFREGDSGAYVRSFSDRKCIVQMHENGYRSVHYLIKTNPGIKTYIAEIQVRTIFEEAWSEIDHTVRYPHNLNNPVLNQFLIIFNRLAGSADEMGTFVSELKKSFHETEKHFNDKVAENQEIINRLEEEIVKLKLSKTESDLFNNILDSIRRRNTSFTYLDDVFSIKLFRTADTKEIPPDVITGSIDEYITELIKKNPSPQIEKSDHEFDVEWPEIERSEDSFEDRTKHKDRKSDEEKEDNEVKEDNEAEDDEEESTGSN